ncbi:efflux RND transporter permease subunit [Rhizobium paknamense]|uniref:Hydrophobe/amphiphile efflux-1 (HAE1) family protein n=1 Tax=Rhizobium paknamense TaxID=1206817 RepID=A0ABU0IHL1_9HYPH|nr:efflux RND transporter permease subunit [Rhizobium paknamense]MDQ0457757.1 hydrophobe/amphiphile efflux-1 (HAE1) family protein [Rhizobium paknamense]
MSFSTPFILRPVATTLLTAALILLGVLGYRLLPVTALPVVDFPTIQVTSRLPGASPATMEALVTTPLESQLGQISGLSSMHSASTTGISRITLEFDLSRNIESASLDVQAAINAAASLLPLSQMPSRPTYAKINPADAPVMILAMTSATLPLEKLNEYADTTVRQRLSRVEGVGLVSIEGGQKSAIRIAANPVAIASLGLSLDDVRQSIVAATPNLPKGSLDGPRQSYQIDADDQLVAPPAYLNQIVAYSNGAPVRLQDVASVKVGLENEDQAAWFNGKRGVILNIQRQPDANTIRVVDAIRTQLQDLKTTLPQSVDLEVLTDRTGTIRASVEEVEFTLVLTIGLVVLVIFLFLRSLWATVIPSVVLPVSLIATFGAMAVAGFTLNNMTLMALTISAGFVVDDAIVMIENIVRHIEAGEKPLDAAIKGARQIGFTVISLSVSLIAVFIPLLLMNGVVGRLFREFSVTLSLAVLFSALVSLTLTPMMCARLLKAGKGGHHEASREEDLGAFNRFYARGLRWVLNHPRLMLLVTLLTVAGTVHLYTVVPKGFLPQQDTGLLIGVTEASPDTSIAALAARQQALVERLLQDPDVEGIGAFVGAGTSNPTANVGRLYINLKPRADRSATADAIMHRLQSAADVPGLGLQLQSVQEVQIGSTSSRTPYQYNLQAATAADIESWLPPLSAELARQPELRDVVWNERARGQQLFVDIDRDLAARLGLSAQTISDALYNAFGQRQIATIYAQASQYRVILEVGPEFRDDPEVLKQIYVRSSDDSMVSLAAFATLKRQQAPLSVTHLGQFPAATISFDLTPGTSLEQGIAAIHRAERAIALPDLFSTGYSGSAAEFQRTLQGQWLLILAALVTVYIVLGVLYESFIHPITILSTLPSAGIGALLALMMAGRELDVMSFIGIILLIGIVKKNAIMMIDFALSAEREHGMTPRDAIYQACLLRFRPIMMTTWAALLGALPLAFGTGIGAEYRQPLGIAIVGGLILSQIVSLYTTPVIYLAFDALQTRLRRLFRRVRPAEPGPVEAHS